MDSQEAVAIIPAYNEATRIGAILRPAVESGLFAKVLVVDDGSVDDTAVVAADYGAPVLSHAINLGKAQAMKTGFEATSQPVVCFIDADLIRVTVDHLGDLVRPVLDGTAQATLATFSGGRPTTTMAQKIAPMISGQRCLRRELLTDFARWDCGFGIETEINAHLVRRGVTPLVVHWQGAGQVMKEEKRGVVVGFGARLSMYRDIVAAWVRNRK